MMRVCLFVAAVLLCVGVVSGQTVTRQGYFNGTASPGGCLTANPADKQTYTIGTCVNATAANDTMLTSAIVNDCSQNGVITISRFNGSDSCNPAFAQDLVELVGLVNNTQFCNAENAGFATWSCSAVAPVNSPVTVNVLAYPFAPPVFSNLNSPTNNCTANHTLPFQFPVGTCTQVAGQQLGVIANCVNGVVTAVFYDTPTCQVVYNYTTKTFANTIIPIGPYAQTGAQSGAGKQPAQPGSTCGLVPGFSFMNFTCVNSATAAPTTVAPSTGGTGTSTTPAPSGNATTAAPTTGAPTKSPASSSTGATGGARQAVAFGIAALVAPIIAAARVLA